ncbi:hypothetical protein [Sorangium sp. So ce861]|uniref:hypothetical protein n=1 Tax=Sorangium sp. So ce861 TaxID=3133323 RepID=UPI003F64725D
MTGEDRFPFDDLLDEVKRSGVAVGPRERLAFARFLSRYDGASREELRTAVASLLARSRAEVELVEGAFDAVFPETEPAPVAKKRGPSRPPPPPPVAPEEPLRAWAALLRWIRPRRRQLGALLATAAIVTSAALWLSPGPPDPAPGDAGSGGASSASAADSSASGASSASGSGGGDVTACRPEEASLQRWYLPAFLLLLGTLLSLGVAGVVRGRRRLLERRRGALTEAFVERPGPRWYDLAPTPDRSARDALDRMSVTLERSLREALLSPEIDVARTVDATARAGLFPTVVRRTRLGRTRAVVLVDTSAASRPFRAALEAFVEALERAGVDVTRLWFAGDPARVAVRPGARAVPLGALAPRLGGRPMILLGTGEAVAAALSDPLEALRVALQPWPASVLLTPIEDPDLWPRGLASPAAAVAAFPLDEHGVLGAARRLAALRSHAAAPAFAPRAERASFDLVDVHLLRAMVALAPRPSFELAEALRRRFLPRAPGSILLAVAPIVEGRETEAERRALARSLREARRSGRFPEAEVRRFLRDALLRAEPADKASAAYLRWEQDVALQDLDAGDGRARRDARAALARLLAGPLGPELEGRLDRERGVRRGIGGPRADLLRVIGHRGLRSLWPPRFALSGAAASSVLGAAALFTAVAAAAGAFSPRPLSMDGRANLVVDAEDLRMALCAFDRFYDVMIEPEATYGLARAPGRPLVAFKVRPVIGPVRAVEAVEQQRDVVLEDAFLGRASGTTLDLITRLPQAEGGERRELDPSSLTVTTAPASAVPVQDSDLLRCQHSLGVLPGTGDDAIARLLDPARRHPSCPPPCGGDEAWCSGAGCTDLTTAENCGRCGNRCPAGSSCVERECRSVCPAGTTQCGDGCVDVMTDPRNCGGCAGGSGKDCGAMSCVGGECRCPDGQPDCDKPGCRDGQPRCGERCCPPLANATARCDGEVCRYSCTAGFQSCNGTMNDGCESNRGVDDNHCGDCTTRCGRDQDCWRGKCILNPVKWRKSCEDACGNRFGKCNNGCGTGKKGPAPDCSEACESDRADCIQSCQSPPAMASPTAE